MCRAALTSCAAGLADPDGASGHEAFALLQMALAVQDSLRERGLPALPGRDIRMRIALHCGPAIAGIVGIQQT